VLLESSEMAELMVEMDGRWSCSGNVVPVAVMTVGRMLDKVMDTQMVYGMTRISVWLKDSGQEEKICWVFVRIDVTGNIARRNDDWVCL